MKVSQDLKNALEADIILFAVPTQKLSSLLGGMGHNLDGKFLVACCKGIDLSTGQGPTSILSKYAPRLRSRDPDWAKLCNRSCSQYADRAYPCL